MKHINNTIETVVINNEERQMSIVDLIEITINNVPQAGLTFKDIQHRLKIKAAIDKAKEKINLEDAEFVYLKDAAETVRWAFVHPILIKYQSIFNGTT